MTFFFLCCCSVSTPVVFVFIPSSLDTYFVIGHCYHSKRISAQMRLFIRSVIFFARYVSFTLEKDDVMIFLHYTMSRWTAVPLTPGLIVDLASVENVKYYPTDSNKIARTQKTAKLFLTRSAWTSDMHYYWQIFINYLIMCCYLCCWRDIFRPVMSHIVSSLLRFGPSTFFF